MRRQATSALTLFILAYPTGMALARERPAPSAAPSSSTTQEAEPAPSGEPPADAPSVEAASTNDAEAPAEEAPAPAAESTPAAATPPPADESGTKDEADGSIELASEEEPEEEEPPYDGPAALLEDGNDSIHIGGYGGLSLQGTSINGDAGLLVGGEGALLLGHRLAIGGAGYGLASEVNGPEYDNGDSSVLGFGYGGVVLRYHIMSKRSPVTASVGTLIGAGGLTLIRKTSTEFDYEYDYDDDSEANAFFVAEPAAQVNLHLTKWMRLGVTGGYRFVRGPSLGPVSDGDLEGVTAGGHMQFGWF